MCKMRIFQAFFLFFKILIFGVFRGLKGQKITYVTRQNDYISRMFFPFFQNFGFSGIRRVKGQKNGPKRQKILFVALHISRTMHLIHVIYGTHV